MSMVTDSSTEVRHALTLRGVTKVYPGDVRAVNKVDLLVRDREFLTLLGPSGSGKTTILKMIAGFTMPTSGVIQIGDRDVSRLPTHKRNIGMVFQNYALFPHLTVDENVAFPLQMRRVARAEIRRRTVAALDLVRLADLGARYPRQLSGGQQQRVALARAIIFEPSLLLMDEPLGALDKRLREGLQLEFKRLHQSLDVTIIYVTHDQEEALFLSDRIAVFHNGQIEQLGTGIELYRTPRSTFVGSFMGDSNIFRGRLVDDATVDVDGVMLRGMLHPEATIKPGEPAALIGRTENCRIEAPGGQSLGRKTSLPATVEQVIYLGSSVKCELRCMGMTLYVRATPRPNEVMPKPEDEVAIEWDVADAVIVAAA
ncbi:MAG: ABC transporter ATP-binding protein [Candidatus Limnocylindrales bacterium]